MTADINHLTRLEHETHEQWKERLLNIDSIADSIKESNTIDIASSIQKSANKNRRESAKEGKKKKGDKRRTSAYKRLNRRASNATMAAGSVSIKDRMAMLQPADNSTEKEEDGVPKTYKTFSTPNNKPTTQPVKSKSGRLSFTRRLSMERIASGLKELRRGSTASETVDETVDNVDHWDELINIRKKNMSSSTNIDHNKTTTPRALTEEESESLRMLLKKKLHMSGGDPSTDDDAEDLLDYAMEMIEEGQSVGCVTEELLSMEMEVFPHSVSDTFGECISTFLLRLKSEEDTKKKPTQVKTKKIVVEEKKKKTTTLQTVQGNTSIAAANPKPTMQTKKSFHGNNAVPSSSSRPSFARRASASLEAAASMSLKERMAMYQKQSSVDADVALAAADEEKLHDKEGKEASKGKKEEVEVNDDKDTAIEILPDKVIEQSEAQDVEPVQEQARDCQTKQQSTTSNTKKKKKSLTSFFRKKN